MLCYAKSLQSCPTLCDPIDGSHQAPPSLGFSRQEHWSGLPFPSPVHKSEKWQWSRSDVSDSSRPHGLQPTRLLRPWDFSGKSTGLGCHCLLRKRLHKDTQNSFSWTSHTKRGTPAMTFDIQIFLMTVCFQMNWKAQVILFFRSSYSHLAI